ncbi:MAG TPA: O-methyltransferase [Chloroflexota bacterium]|nr:O-methyltransferase [Chloroflexota bacterium]
MDETPLQHYADELYGGEDPLLAQMRDEAVREGVPAIQVPPELGRLLQVMVASTRATRVLELGTLFGYSSIVMARALPPGGRILSLEFNEKHAAIARRNFERAGVADRIEVRVGRALDLLPSLQGQSFGLVFIDADKESYPSYLEWSLRLTQTGAAIVADNVWRHGSVMDADDADSRGLAQFNRDVTHNPALITAIVPRLSGSDAASVSVVR